MFTSMYDCMNPRTTSLRHLILEAKKDAPNYTVASNKEKSCATCGAFEEWGYCDMFDFAAQGHMTCDDWITPQEWAKED